MYPCIMREEEREERRKRKEKGERGEISEPMQRELELEGEGRDNIGEEREREV